MRRGTQASDLQVNRGLQCRLVGWYLEGLGGLSSPPQAPAPVASGAESVSLRSGYCFQYRPDTRQELGVCRVVPTWEPEENCSEAQGRLQQGPPHPLPWSSALASLLPADLCQPELPGDPSVCI